MQGIIIENIANLYKVKANGKIYNTTARGKFKNEGISPVVGDIVDIKIEDEEKDVAVIEEIKKRKTYIKRPKISNITQIIFVVSSKNPKPDLLLLDKQLAYAEFLNIKPIIILNKIDLDDKEEFEKIKNVYNNIGYTVIKTEAKSKKGIENLIKELKNNISAFSGNSGVGKSTLINGIFDEELTKEGEISKRNKKGKNTTTIIKLYEIEENTYIADTPGFSTFDISEIESKDLSYFFREFKEFLSDCEFQGCSHVKENNCGIKQAVEKGIINKGRYERFVKIYEELKFKEEKRW